MSGKYDNLHPQVPQAGVHLRKQNLRCQKMIKRIRKEGKAYFLTSLSFVVKFCVLLPLKAFKIDE